MSLNPFKSGINFNYLFVINLIFTLLFLNLLFLILIVDINNGKMHVIALSIIVILLWLTVNW